MLDMHAQTTFTFTSDIASSADSSPGASSPDSSAAMPGGTPPSVSLLDDSVIVGVISGTSSSSSLGLGTMDVPEITPVEGAGAGVSDVPGAVLAAVNEKPPVAGTVVVATAADGAGAKEKPSGPIEGAGAGAGIATSPPAGASPSADIDGASPFAPESSASQAGHLLSFGGSKVAKHSEHLAVRLASASFPWKQSPQSDLATCSCEQIKKEQQR